MAVAEATHQSCRGQKTAAAAHNAPRRQKKGDVEVAETIPSQHLNSQIVLFFVLFNTVVFSFFFASRLNVPLFFWGGEMCGRVGNEMPGKGNISVTKRWVRLDNKRWRRTSLIVNVSCF